MITKNSIRFDTPVIQISIINNLIINYINYQVENCPTKDNVRVSVDIGITFHIGKEETRQDDCEKFLYYLGANKLEELLE